jgi:iron complex transport system substrate-binding protein
MRTFPGKEPSGCDPKPSDHMRIALAAHSCRDSRRMRKKSSVLRSRKALSGAGAIDCALSRRAEDAQGLSLTRAFRHKTMMVSAATRCAFVYLATAFLLGAAPAPVVKPQRIVSMNQCTDLLLLQLVPKARIASISFLTHEAVWAVAPGADEGIATNRGAVEDLIAARPDLIIVGRYGATSVRQFVERLDAPVLVMDEANGFDEIRAVTRKLGDAVGERTRAEALLARMDSTLADLAQTKPSRTISIAAWSGGDYVSGKGTLTNAIIEAAGAVNIAAKLPDARTNTFGIEELLAARPDALLYADNAPEQPSLRAAQTQTRVVQRLYKGRMLTYPSPLYSCGLPQSAEAAVQLRAQLSKLEPLEPWK